MGDPPANDRQPDNGPQNRRLVLRQEVPVQHHEVGQHSLREPPALAIACSAYAAPLKPGITSAPAASMTSVRGPRNRFTSSCTPPDVDEATVDDHGVGLHGPIVTACTMRQ